MALIKCPECKQQISSEAESCPNCGFSKKRKSGCGCTPLVIGMALGLVVLIIIMSLMTESSDVITDERTYSQSWTSPSANEYVEIGRIIVKNNIKVCGEYYVKEIENGELVIACTGNGKDWEYFVVYTNLDKIYRANEEMESKLNSPR
jgi:hypothetical protein